MTLNIAVLASGNATDMDGILKAIGEKRLDARIAILISNKADSPCLEKARKHGIKAVFIDHRGKERETYDKEVVSELEKNKADLVLLLGFMRIISPYFVSRFRDRIMNVHPSLLPCFAGGMDTGVHEKILERGAKLTGATLHFVSEECDGGPIIMQRAVGVSPEDDVARLKGKIQKAEQEMLVKAIRLFGKGKIKVEGNRVRVLE